MGQSGEDGLQIFLRSFWRAGKIDDERALPNPRLGPGQHGPGRDLQRGVPHGLRDAGRQPVTDRQSGLRRHIPGGESGAAGGHQQLDLTAVGNGF